MEAIIQTSYGKVGLSTVPLTDTDISKFTDKKLDLSKTGLDNDYRGTWGLASKSFVVAAINNHGEHQESHIDLRSKLSDCVTKISILEQKIEKLEKYIHKLANNSNL